MSKVRVRFAPSPTGGLHLGGVRTVLYNYLFARQHNGAFIVRTEDTDQTRFVAGAEQYIFDCLAWCGLTADESTVQGGDYGPYRQSERKAIYKEYAQKLVDDGKAYLAFDTPEEIEQMRENLKATGSNSLQYDHAIRRKMKNSVSLMPGEVDALLAAGTPYVIRLKVEPNEILAFNDIIRGEISFDTTNVDDKVLLKADGMPTYHLAVVVDDYLMKISHAFRGEEWLPSAPIHILLWKYLFGLDNMPQWAHLPLILKPDGNGKLSKRDGDRLGFPVYAMNWTYPNTHETTSGFKENGFLPEAFINLLAVLGWNDGTEQEVFSLDELIEKFSLEKVHKGGAKFDYEKAKWFNHEWIKKLPAAHYAERVANMFAEHDMAVTADERFVEILELVKDRCTLLTDFYEQAGYFYSAPATIDVESIRPKWTPEKNAFFDRYAARLHTLQNWTVAEIETTFKLLATEAAIKPGELQLPMRIMLVGGKFGPGVFDIAMRLGKDETISRTQHAQTLIN